MHNALAPGEAIALLDFIVLWKEECDDADQRRVALHIDNKKVQRNVWYEE